MKRESMRPNGRVVTCRDESLGGLWNKDIIYTVSSGADTARLIPAKMTSMLRYLSAFLIIILALSCASSAAPSEPQHPGDQATPEQLEQYYSDLWQYITFITRPRFGKRGNEIGVEDVPSY